MSEVDTAFEYDAMAELAREVLEEDEESARAYLVQSWLSSAIEKLYDARRQADLTQEELAQQLGTKQPAIARLESDDEGKVSLHRYVEVALACGFLPLEISLRPAEALQEYALNDPDAPRTETAFEAWNSKVVSYGNVMPTTFLGTDLGAHNVATNSSSELKTTIPGYPEGELEVANTPTYRNVREAMLTQTFRYDREQKTERQVKTTTAEDTATAEIAA